MKHKSERESYVYMPGLERGGAAGPVLLDDGRGVVLPGTGAGEGEVGLTRPSKPGMAELGMLKLSCFNCLPEPAAQGELRLRWARVGRSIIAQLPAPLMAKMTAFKGLCPVILPLSVSRLLHPFTKPVVPVGVSHVRSTPCRAVTCRPPRLTARKHMARPNWAFSCISQELSIPFRLIS